MNKISSLYTQVKLRGLRFKCKGPIASKLLEPVEDPPGPPANQISSSFST